jgi:hypothetical protein
MAQILLFGNYPSFGGVPVHLKYLAPSHKKAGYIFCQWRQQELGAVPSEAVDGCTIQTIL